MDDLPKYTEKPILREITTSRLPIIEWALVRPKAEDGNYTVSYKQLRQLAMSLEEHLLRVDGIAHIIRRGWQNSEIFVDISPTLMRRHKVGSNDVVRALKRRNVSLPGGDIELKEKETIVRTMNEFNTAKEISQTPILYP